MWGTNFYQCDGTLKESSKICNSEDKTLLRGDNTKKNFSLFFSKTDQLTDWLYCDILESADKNIRTNDRLTIAQISLNFSQVWFLFNFTIQ